MCDKLDTQILQSVYESEKTLENSVKSQKSNIDAHEMAHARFAI